MSDQTELAKNIQYLLDLEALKQLKYQYCAHCDDNYNAEGIAALFTEDAIWDGGDIGKLNGRMAIRDFFAASSEVVPFAIHSVSNPRIEIIGDKANCRWYLWQPMVFNEDNQAKAYWFAAEYEDQCVRQNNQWLFKHVTARTKMLCPYHEGFAQTQIVENYPGN